MTKAQRQKARSPRAQRAKALLAVLEAISAYFQGPGTEEDVRRVVEAAMTARFGGYSVTKR